MQHHSQLAGPELQVRAGFRRDQVTYDTLRAGVLLVQVPGSARRARGDPDIQDEACRQDGREDQEVSSHRVFRRMGGDSGRVIGLISV